MRLFLHFLAGVVAGAVGFLAGLFVLLSVSGLERADLAPVVALSGAALTGTATVSLLARLPAATTAGLALGAAAVGAVIGSLLDFAGDSYDLSIVAGIILIAGATLVAASIGKDDEIPAHRRESSRHDAVID
ncbi:MAG: hypothetical protein KJO18_04325 [Acidimicrobiia bacterium]|nr:hypothetical protein [Acidimicrobiia bacterium]